MITEGPTAGAGEDAQPRSLQRPGPGGTVAPL